FRGSLEIGRRLGEKRTVILALEKLASVATRRGDYREATRLLEECLKRFLQCALEISDTPPVLDSLVGLAELRAPVGDGDRVRRALAGILAHPAAAPWTPISNARRPARNPRASPAATFPAIPSRELRPVGRAGHPGRPPQGRCRGARVQGATGHPRELDQQGQGDLDETDRRFIAAVGADTFPFISGLEYKPWVFTK
ncbi:MAG TPA: tetratricopeptide repeat protein, partial [Archangium sp.]|nr:tetratricopeptide repeat protein [Archangium sp.]